MHKVLAALGQTQGLKRPGRVVTPENQTDVSQDDADEEPKTKRLKFENKKYDTVGKNAMNAGTDMMVYYWTVDDVAEAYTCYNKKHLTRDSTTTSKRIIINSRLR